MYYSDMSKYVYYLKRPLESVLNVGWLDAKYDFNKGIVSNKFLKNLEAIISSEGAFDAHFHQIRGAHPCCICGEEGVWEVGPNNIVLGSSELWIPDVKQGRYFAVPSLIHHYIKDHAYLPPKKFIKAVVAINIELNFNAYDKYLKLTSYQL